MFCSFDFSVCFLFVFPRFGLSMPSMPSNGSYGAMLSKSRPSARSGSVDPDQSRCALRVSESASRGAFRRFCGERALRTSEQRLSIWTCKHYRLGSGPQPDLLSARSAARRGGRWSSRSPRPYRSPLIARYVGIWTPWVRLCRF